MNLKDIKDLDKSQILGMLGLEERTTTSSMLLRSLGLIGLGALVGAGVGLLYAPRSGRELREDLGRRIKDGSQRAMEGVSSLSEGVIANS